MFLLVFSFRDLFVNHTRLSPRPASDPESKALTVAFIKGLVVASALVSIVVVAQQIWGFDGHFQQLDDRRLMGGVLYRATAFYGHPMTLASVSLTLFVWLLILKIKRALTNKSLFPSTR